MEFSFDALLWKWQGDAGWHFISLPEDVADEIEDHPGPRGGFGSIRVRMRVGATTWTTSLFPDKKRGTLILPVRKQVRLKEGLGEGEMVTLHLETLE
jgi:hypothetical protein